MIGEAGGVFAAVAGTNFYLIVSVEEEDNTFCKSSYCFLSCSADCLNFSFSVFNRSSSLCIDVRISRSVANCRIFGGSKG